MRTKETMSLDKQTSQSVGRPVRLIILVIVGLLLAALVGYLIGYRNGAESVGAGKTFYATLEQRQTDQLSVTGLEVNDINYRGEFTFRVTSDTEISWRSQILSLDDLSLGDRLAITFVGPVLESYPAQLSRVTHIKKLND